MKKKYSPPKIVKGEMKTVMGRCCAEYGQDTTR